MFINYRTQGIILKKKDLGETDQLFTIYTKDFGKIEILGKAIRKISSKLRSGADIFYLSNIEFIQGKTHKTLTDAILIEKFRNLRKSLKRLRIAYKISEVFDNLVKGQEPDQEIWHLLNETFEKLNNLSFDICHLSLLYYYFLWNLLSTLGYRPELYNCSLCQKKLEPENLYFNSKEGGIICNQCYRKIKKGKQINLGTIKILRILLKKDWPTLNRLKIETEDFKSLKLISDYFLLYLKKAVIGSI
jgi:DNA repair protein RecO (recombination protein O)